MANYDLNDPQERERQRLVEVTYGDTLDVESAVAGDALGLAADFTL
jgi:hypothetical protein